MTKKELIFNAALKLFVDKGFHGTATSKIAQEASVANGTLFQYFKTKDDLVIALYISVKDELNEYISINTSRKDDIKETIKSQVFSSLVWGLDNQTKIQYIQQFQTSPYIGQIEKEIIAKQAEPHLTLLKKGIEEGIIKNLPIELLNSLMTSQFFGLYQFLIANKLSKSKQQEIIQTTFEMLWDMIT
ncbi:TetR/AcrR family transcriptional regulator [Flavobacterium psychrotolerans]|uniref:TetR family transcriptional regulator n=1 Tax=Flavobacterium psychrotolerans TaxID=2169410 RepID=A0A2U1JLL9_9FLAO|nr:TetR/AcrR family transcriptional regulator [Flavobacterium psychrotolerans]PWA05874.1 TetR family transcriptional regulator [Flavobacterium psychrotolerans]